MTVAEMMHRMSSEEFTRWEILYDKVDPFGDYRGDLRIGVFASALVNILLKVHAKNPTLVKPSDFIIDLLREPPKQSVSEMKAALKAMAQAWGKVKTKRPSRSNPKVPKKAR